MLQLLIDEFVPQIEMSGELGVKLCQLRNKKVLPPFFFYCCFKQGICTAVRPKTLVRTSIFLEWRSIINSKDKLKRQL
jgi:hypothetical protein